MTDKVSLSPRIAVPPERIEAFCRQHHIRKLALFGSVLTEDFTDTSDVDVLVEFKEGHTPDFFRFIGISDELSVLFDGRPIDLVTYKALNRHLRRSILEAAQVEYEEA